MIGPRPGAGSFSGNRDAYRAAHPTGKSQRSCGSRLRQFPRGRDRREIRRLRLLISRCRCHARSIAVQCDRPPIPHPRRPGRRQGAGRCELRRGTGCLHRRATRHLREGCLLCNKLINSAKLQEESISAADRKQQRYIDEPEIVAPSVITLNATAVSHAANDFLFYMTGLRDLAATTAYMRFQAQRRRVWFDEPRKSAECPECGNGSRSRLARGDARPLPIIHP